MSKYLKLLAVLLPALALASDLRAESTVSYTGTAGVSSKLTSGRHLIRCTTDCYYVMGNSNAIAATSADIPLLANEKWEIWVEAGNRYISFVRQGSSGTAYVYPVVE